MWKGIQQCYDIFRILRAVIFEKGLECSETHIVGTLISRRIISVIWSGDEQIKPRRKYDEMRTGRIRARGSNASPDINTQNKVSYEPEKSEEKKKAKLEYTAQSLDYRAPNTDGQIP